MLRQRAAEVTPEQLQTREVQQFIDDLVETMRDANGAGLAAIQVQRPIRIFAVEVSKNPRYPYKPNIPLTIVANPVFKVLSEETFDNFEGCLSVPDMRGVVPRYAKVQMSGLDRQGVSFERELRGLTAGTFQHEADHLDGKLFLDRVVDTTSLCTWAAFERYHKAAFVERIVPFIERWGG